MRSDAGHESNTKREARKEDMTNNRKRWKWERKRGASEKKKPKETNQEKKSSQTSQPILPMFTFGVFEVGRREKLTLSGETVVESFEAGRGTTGRRRDAKPLPEPLLLRLHRHAYNKRESGICLSQGVIEGGR